MRRVRALCLPASPRVRGWDLEMLWGRRRGDGTIVAVANRWSAPMPQPNDLSRSLVALDQDSTIIAVVEMSQSSWLGAGMLPGIERQPRKKLEPSAERLLGLLHRWRDEAVKAGRKITRIALAFEAGRDGFWLARWLRARGVEAHVIHASSVAVSREHRRAKTDRLDTELLKRGFLGWLRGERGHCSMARVPTIAEEEAGLVLDKIRRRFLWLELIWADGGYNAWQVDAAVAKVPPPRMEIVKRSDDMKGFVVLPRRWVVERTFSWFGRNRRLAKDFENLTETLATFVTPASIQLALR